MIRLHEVSKSYPVGGGGRVVVLDRVTADLDCARGIGILGGNGAGKSTLVRVISGSEPPDAGRVARSGRVSWPLGLGGTFQPSLTGRENVRFVARVYGADPDAMVGEVDEFAELGRFMDAPVSTYSNGMKARLAFGVSLAVDFDAYLVDELVGVGDERFRRKSREAFQAKARHAKVIMVSHEARTIREYCDRAAVLHGGRLTVYNDLDEAFQAHRRIMGS